MPRLSPFRPVVSTLLAVIGGVAPLALPSTAVAMLGAEEGPTGMTPDSPIIATLAEGMMQYRAGRMAQAVAAFSAALKLNPSDRQTYDWYLAAGDALLVVMAQRDELRDVIDPLLRKARFYQKSLRRDPAYQDILVAKLKGESEEERIVATNELVAVGPIAVPKLLAQCADNREDKFSIFARIALTRMGHRAVLPLIEALNSKNVKVQRTTVMILGDIGDPRALRPMQLLLTDATTDATVKSILANSIASISRQSRVSAGSVEELYLSEALRYLRDTDITRDELVASESLLWRWDDKDGKAEDGEAIAKALTYVRAPNYAWNELMAEEILFDLAAARPTYAPTYAVLAAVFAAQDSEPRLRQRMLKEATHAPQVPEGFPAAITERADAVSGGGSGLSDRAKTLGPASLYRGLQYAVSVQRYDAFAGLAGILSDRTIARPELHLPSASTGFSPERLGTPLVAALDHSSKAVRYPAAVTLARLDPNQPFLNAEKVVPVLTQAVGEWGMRVILVIDQDFRARNSARATLQSKGFLVRTVEDGMQAMQVLDEAPVKDVIIIQGDLLPTLRDEHGGKIDVPQQTADGMVKALRADPRSAKTPIFISLPEDPAIAVKIRAALDGKVDGFMGKPFDAGAVANAIEASLVKAELPNVNREEAEAVALAAAKALQVPDPLTTQFDLLPAADALLKAMENRVDPLRIECCKALSNISRQKGGLSQHAIRLCDMYVQQDASLIPALRVAWLEAIGAIAASAPNAPDIISKALMHEDANVRAAAALAAARINAANPAAAIPENGGTLLRFLQDRRMDLRTQGAGSETP